MITPLFCSPFQFQVNTLQQQNSQLVAKNAEVARTTIKPFKAVVKNAVLASTTTKLGKILNLVAKMIAVRDTISTQTKVPV